MIVGKSSYTIIDNCSSHMIWYMVVQIKINYMAGKNIFVNIKMDHL